MPPYPHAWLVVPTVQEEEEREYARWLKGQPATIAKEEAKDMVSWWRYPAPWAFIIYPHTHTHCSQAALHHHWTDPNLPSDEAFLRDYILNREYIDKETDRCGIKGKGQTSGAA